MKRVVRFILAAGALVVSAASAFGQGSILQGGPTTPGHVPMYTSQGSGQTIVQDSGSASGAPTLGVGLAELLLTVRNPLNIYPAVGAGSGPLGSNWCDYDAPINNPTGYHYVCLSPNPGQLIFGAGGAASPLPFSFNINGTSFSFPTSGSGFGIATVSIPASNGSVVCFSGTTGLLAPCPGITNANLATVPAATFKGNPTATANVAPTDFTIQGLPARGAPDANNDKIPIYNFSTGAIDYVTPGLVASSATAGVSSLCTLTGALTATQVTACLNLFSNSLQGLVPASGGGVTTFLRADGTFATPPTFGSAAPGYVPSSGGGTINFLRADGTFANPISGGSAPLITGGRLTLASQTPVMVASQTSIATLYYDTYFTSTVAYFTGTIDTLDTIASNEVSTAMQAGGTGVLNANGVFDVWWEGNTHHNICIATNGSGGGWASDAGGSQNGSNTQRASGTASAPSGYSQLDTTTRPYITNAKAITHCYNGSTDYGSIVANRLTYLGTVLTDAASSGVISFTLGTAAAGGGAARIGLWNAYNRVPIKTTVADNTASWTYAVANTFRAANASTTARITAVYGINQDPADVSYLALGIAGASTLATSGVGLDTTTAFCGAAGLLANGVSGSAPARCETYPGVGVHFFQAIEAQNSTTATTWVGPNSPSSPIYASGTIYDGRY